MHSLQRKSLLLAILCLYLHKISDTVCSNRKLFDIKGSHIQPLVDIAKPIIDAKYQEYAQLFTNSNDTDPQALELKRKIAINLILLNSDEIFEKEASEALKALDSIKFDQKIKIITINSLIRTASKKLIVLARKWVQEEGLA